MYYTHLEDLIDDVALVLDSMGYEDYSFDKPTYDEVMKHGKGFLFVEVYKMWDDGDEIAYDLESKLGRYVRVPVEVTVERDSTHLVLLIEFETVTDYD